MTELHALWLGALVLLLVSLLVLLPTLLKEQAAAPLHSTDETLRNLYRAQLDELDRELHAGNLSAADRAQAEDELQRRLLTELDQRTVLKSWKHNPWLVRMTGLVLAVLVPIAALGLYLQVGDPQAAARLAQSDELGHGAGQLRVESMVDGLAQRLQAEPDNLPGWVMLARSYEVMERYADADQAYQRAIALAAKQDARAQEQARLWADRADAQASAGGGDLKMAATSIEQALSLDAAQPKALALAGAAAVQQGEFDKARTHWQALLALLEPGSEVALQVQDDLMKLELMQNP